MSATPRNLVLRAVPCLAVLGGLVTAAHLPATPAAADPTVVNRIVLRVNDRVATLRDYQRRKTELEQAILAREDLTLQQRREAMSSLGLRVYRQIYEELLLLSRADQLDIAITEGDINAEIERIREQMGLTDQQQFERALMGTGLTPEALREQTRKNLLTQTVIGREVYARMAIDEEILRRYYRDNPEEFMLPERYRLREIVVLEDGGRGLEERLRLAEELRQQVLGGKTLDEVAEEGSATGATSALIDLGWVSASDLSPELREAVETLEPGAVSPPVEARGGSHLLEMVEREEAELQPFSDVADQIRLIERQRRSLDEIEKFFTRLEDEAYVVLDPPEEARGFRGLTRGEDGGAETATGVPSLLAAPAAATPSEATTSEEAGDADADAADAAPPSTEPDSAPEPEPGG